MDQNTLNERLSRISTLWSMVFQAHAGSGDAAAVALNRLMQRYSGAVYRYLLGAIRDPDTAADLCQEFALRFLRGDFRRAAPERGRFRDYVKTALIHLVTDHHRTQQARPRSLPGDVPELAAPSAESEDSDRAFLASWREELLDRTWRALARVNPAYHAALLLRIDHPDLPSPRMAEELTARLGRPFTAASVRKTLQRAHEKYADLLVAEVETSLDEPTAEDLEKELSELDLLRYCRSALQRRGRGQ